MRSSRPPAPRPSLALALVAGLAALLGPPRGDPPPPATAQPSPAFTNFETEPVRPLALSPDDGRLFAVNTADDRLEIFDLTADGLARAGEVGVGLRPVAVAARSAGEVWVSNHLSDSVSRVDVSDPRRARVVATVRVGDEPRDIVVAGPNRDLIFVATAFRGEPFAPGVGRGSVWVIDAERPEAPPREIRLFGQKPRALAASADGRTVYAAVFHSGNATTVVGEADVERGGGPPPPDPPNQTGQAPPGTGLIVQQRGSRWLDEAGRDWGRYLPFRLPDQDVFVIDAAAEAPAVVGAVAGAGTTLFNLAARPGTGEVWLTNTEAHNAVRFEPKLRGQVVDNRVTRLAPRDGDPGRPLIPAPVDLNPHVARGTSPGPAAEIAQSLAQPTDIVFSRDGQRAYVAAFGSRKVGVLDGEGQVVDRIEVGFGPGGLALDEARERLYVLNHLDASIAVVDLAAGAPGRGAPTLATVPLRFDPTPAEVRAGRPFLYDAALTGGHGDMSCASCHVFGDMDHLAWDLGDPTAKPVAVPGALMHSNILLRPRRAQFHPMKGPMTTQSLRGLAGAGPMHWRADRFGPGAAAGDELASFMQFNPAFVGLNGRASALADAEMSAYGRFVLSIRYPPNPIQNPDRSLTPDQQAGFDFFTGPVRVDQGVATCQDCHALPLGTNRRINFEGDQIQQDFKAAHLRNLYDKVGRFDAPGDQVAGFGFVHNGAFDTLVTFLELDVFRFPGSNEAERGALRRSVAEYLLAFDTGMAPAVGQQLTAGASLPPADRARLDLLAARAGAGDCDLVARCLAEGRERGYLLARETGGLFRTDRASEVPLTLADLLAQAARPSGEVTFTCVPPGDGPRSALDRDGDGFLGGDEIAAGSDPANAASNPGNAPSATPSLVPTTTSTPPPTSTPTGTPGIDSTPTAAATRTGTGEHWRARAWLPVGYAGR